MDLSISTVNWIGTYMEWTDALNWTFGASAPALSGTDQAKAEANEQFAASYLDWIDARW